MLAWKAKSIKTRHIIIIRGENLILRRLLVQITNSSTGRNIVLRYVSGEALGSSRARCGWVVGFTAHYYSTTLSGNNGLFIY